MTQQYRRKIVKHGPSTLTVSIPTIWANKHGIKKGTEVILTALHSSLTISTLEPQQENKQEINLVDRGDLIEKAICGCYKAGVNELAIYFDTQEELEAIHTALTYGVVGWEIFDETNTKIQVRTLSNTNYKEFNPILRRLFLSILTIAEDSLDAAKKKDVQAAQKLILRDRTVNKLSDVCRRIINQSKQIEYERPAVLYHIVAQLEKIADVFKELNELFVEKESFSLESLETYAQATRCLRDFYEMFFQYNLDRLVEYSQKTTALKKKIAQQKTITREMILIEMLTRECRNLTGALLTLYQQRD